MILIEPEQITKMMSDLYISEDAVNMTGERQGLWVRFRAIEKAVSEIPTIDAVPVVRCGECKHMIADGRCMEFADDGIRPSAMDYCSYGARREISRSDFCPNCGARMKGGEE